MKMRLLLVGLVVALGGCAAIEQNEVTQQEIWLQQAGFRVLKADTPSREASLAQMQPYKLEVNATGQTTLYRYADSAKKLVYVGTPQQYAAYKQIAVATKSRRAAEMAATTSNPMRMNGPMGW